MSDFKSPRGTRDIHGAEVVRFLDIETIARDLFIYYGYSEIRTPIFESRGLYERSVGDDTDIVAKELYVFRDRKDRELALRPEGTAGVVRAYIENNLAATGTIQKYFYFGPMFRYERPQGGRYRQFYQLGCEMFGAAGPTADLEIIDVASRLLQRLSIPAHLKVNYIGCAACKSAFSAAIAAYFSTRREELCPDCHVRLERNPLRLLDCKVPACREIAASAPNLSLCEKCSTNFSAITKGLNSFGIEFSIDPRMVRGLDYYTGLVFEMISAKLGAQDAVLGGGRYDGLVAELGGPATAAVGFAIGIDRLARLIEISRESSEQLGEPLQNFSKPIIYVVGLDDESQMMAAVLTRRLRRLHETRTLSMSTRPEWIEQSLKSRSLKAHLREADKLHAAYVAIIGENERQAGTATFREMAHGAQGEVSWSNLDDAAFAESVVRVMNELKRR